MEFSNGLETEFSNIYERRIGGRQGESEMAEILLPVLQEDVQGKINQTIMELGSRATTGFISHRLNQLMRNWERTITDITDYRIRVEPSNIFSFGNPAIIYSVRVDWGHYTYEIRIALSPEIFDMGLAREDSDRPSFWSQQPGQPDQPQQENTDLPDNLFKIE